MGASRETFNIWLDIRQKKWTKVKMSLKLLFVFNKKNWRREYIITDSFIRPFNKKIGCKIFGHKWSTEEEIRDEYDRFYCWKCGRWQTKEERRDDKIKRLLK
jgi:hypothetical protein